MPSECLLGHDVDTFTVFDFPVVKHQTPIALLDEGRMCLRSQIE